MPLDLSPIVRLVKARHELPKYLPAPKDVITSVTGTPTETGGVSYTSLLIGLGLGFGMGVASCYWLNKWLKQDTKTF